MAGSGRALVGVVVCSAVVWWAWPAAAGAEAAGEATSQAICQFEVHDRVDSSFEPFDSGQGTLTSRAGTIACTGVIARRPVSDAAGTLRWRLRYGGGDPLDGGNCVYGRATGSWEASLPMRDGSRMLLTGPVEVAWNAAAVWKLSGRFGGHGVHGAGVSRSDHELRYAPAANCFTTVSRFTVQSGYLAVAGLAVR
ncbi:MAG TPA: hypothetical protein VGL92_18465 [Acidimicrobiia bacterium]|jgi:hypothetical protein